MTLNLRERTLAAMQAGKCEAGNKARVRQETDRQETDRQQQRAAIQAQKVIARIPLRAMKAARKGQPYAVVMALDAEFDYQSDWHEHYAAERYVAPPEPQQLIGAAKLVYAACADAGLQPVITGLADEDCEPDSFFICIPII